MGHFLHPGGDLLHIHLPVVGEQSTDGQRQRHQRLPAGNQRIPALAPLQLLRSRQHILIVVSHQDQIVGIVGNGGSDGAAPEPDA